MPAAAPQTYKRLSKLPEAQEDFTQLIFDRI
jgi:hypothetical protein